MVSSLFSIRFDEPEITTAPESSAAADRYGSFVAGPENALLEPVARSILAGRHRFSPIFLYGPPAVGKSHLLNGLASAYCQRHAQARVVSLTGADFARSLATAVEVDALADVRRVHHKGDLLVLDNVEELIGKTHAQHELLHTLDALSQRGALVLAAARRAPAELPLTCRLRSRLAGGLVVALRLPAAATRRFLLPQLAEELEIELSDQLLANLAQTDWQDGDYSLPELRGLLLQLHHVAAAHAGNHGEARPQTSSRPAAHAPPRRIIQQVARHFGLQAADLKGVSRRRTTVLARGLAIYLIRQFNGSSFEQLGRLFGNRDHTTVLHAYRRIEKRKTEPHVRTALRELMHTLGGSGLDQLLTEQTPGKD